MRMEGEKNGGRISFRGREGGDKYESDLGKTLTQANLALTGTHLP
jgi:hypothetical protein